jgi:hypothetical protein
MALADRYAFHAEQIPLLMMRYALNYIKSRKKSISKKSN